MIKKEHFSSPSLIRQGRWMSYTSKAISFWTKLSEIFFLNEKIVYLRAKVERKFAKVSSRNLVVMLVGWGKFHFHCLACTEVNKKIHRELEDSMEFN